MSRTAIFLIMIYSISSQAETIRVATFNVSMEASNYLAPSSPDLANGLQRAVFSGKHQQIRNIAEIIQRVRPQIILLNEFDYSQQSWPMIKGFIEKYLNQAQEGALAIDYPYFYTAAVNTGVDSGLDLDKDGLASGIKADALGYGLFPGHYGMLLLSQFPIAFEEARTFQHFLWKDMPNNLLHNIREENGQAYYSQKAQSLLPLSSKSHWDIPIKVNEQTIHILASHPTPPVFDGPENRNGKRNHDEIRFWADYLSAAPQSTYIYDDKAKQAGLTGAHFVILGDLNASPEEGDGIPAGIKSLLAHPRVNDQFTPSSEGAKQHTLGNPQAATHTANWGMRADYVLPSVSLEVIDSGVFWPKLKDPLYRLIKNRQSSSDHRAVWVDIRL